MQNVPYLLLSAGDEFFKDTMVIMTLEEVSVTL